MDVKAAIGKEPLQLSKSRGGACGVQGGAVAPGGHPGGGTLALAIALFCQRATANTLPLYIAAWLCDDDDQCMARWVSCLPHHHDEDQGNLQLSLIHI